MDCRVINAGVVLENSKENIWIDQSSNGNNTIELDTSRSLKIAGNVEESQSISESNVTFLKRNVTYVIATSY